VISIHYLIVKQSDLYPASHFRSALFFGALALTALFYLPVSWENPFPVIAIISGFFLTGYILAHFKRFKRLFTFGHEMKEEVYQMGLEAKNDYQIGKRSIFIFISLMERRIECFVSPDLKEEINSKRITGLLKEARSNFKSKGSTVAAELLKDSFEKEFNIRGPVSSPESTIPHSDNKSDSRLLENDEVSPLERETDQNNSEEALPQETKAPQPDLEESTKSTASEEQSAPDQDGSETLKE
jgi:hypothetical protein